MPIFRKLRPNRSSFGDILDEVAVEAPPAPRRERLRSSEATLTLADKLVVGTVSAASVAFCVYAIAATVNDPNYFSERLIASLQGQKNLDPIETGTIAAPEAAVDALPVPIVARASELKPEDYQIVMVFDQEAILATSKELFRVKVGSTLPGLGLVKEIVPSGDGGTVAAEKATLKTAPN